MLKLLGHNWVGCRSIASTESLCSIIPVLSVYLRGMLTGPNGFCMNVVVSELL